MISSQTLCCIVSILTVLLSIHTQATPLSSDSYSSNHKITLALTPDHVSITSVISRKSQAYVGLWRKTLSQPSSKQQNGNLKERKSTKNQLSLDKKRNESASTSHNADNTHGSTPALSKERTKRGDKQLSDSTPIGSNQDTESHAIPVATNESTHPDTPQSDATISAANARNNEGEQREEGEDSSLGASSVFSKARLQGGQFVNGGFVEFIEWLFVFILVAPGTFPAIGCVLLTCTNFWRRRLNGPAADSAVAPRESEATEVEVATSSAPATHQRTAHADHAPLVARPRKGTVEERESEI